MKIHLITTDESVFQLFDTLAGRVEVSYIIVPSNRRASEKIARVRAEACRRGIAVAQHQAGCRFDVSLPPAQAAVSWLYSQLIKNEDLLRYPSGILNMHGGKIPDYRGASVLHWAMLNGESELGITWHEMVEEVDAGMIRAETAIPIPPEATALEMRQAMIQAAIALFPLAWERFLAKSGGRWPDLAGGRVWPQRRPDDGLIPPGLTVRQLRDMIRTLCPPWPPAFVEQEGERLAVARLALSPVAGAVVYHTVDGVMVYLVPVTSGLPSKISRI